MSFFGAQLRQVNLIFISIELLWLYWSVLRYMQSLNKDFLSLAYSLEITVFFLVF